MRPAIVFLIGLAAALAAPPAGRAESVPGNLPVTAWQGLLDADDPAERQRAIDALGAIGPGARQAVPALARLLKDERLRPGVETALVRIGAAAAPDLTKALDSPD